MIQEDRKPWLAWRPAGGVATSPPANGTYWLSIDNGFPNQQVSVTAAAGITLRFEIFYPDNMDLQAPNFSYDTTALALTAQHDTGATERLPNGVVCFRDGAERERWHVRLLRLGLSAQPGGSRA